MQAAQKGGKLPPLSADLQYMHQVGFEALQDTEVDHSNRIVLGGVEIALGDGGPKKALPAGTVKTTYKGWEEYCVPATQTAALRENERLVAIGDLESWAQAAFVGYKTLNRIQSRIYQVRLLPPAHLPPAASLQRSCRWCGLSNTQPHVRNSVTVCSVTVCSGV